MVGTAAKFAFDVIVRFRADAESYRVFIFNEDAIAFAVVHHHRVQPVNVWVRAAPVVVFVIVVRFDFTESFLNDELTRVFDVIGVINDR
jgi:hypothetical protein